MFPQENFNKGLQILVAKEDSKLLLETCKRSIMETFEDLISASEVLVVDKERRSERQTVV